MTRALIPTVIKSLIFIVITVLVTMMLASTIRNSAGGGNTFHAIFADATSLHTGDDIRMAGVRVGSVTGIELHHNRLAEVDFTVAGDVPVPEGTTAKLRFRNLVGQRYIALVPPTGSGSAPVPAGYTFPLSQTEPALDLTMLFNGFQPLFRALNPADINRLSAQIISVFQGEGSTVQSLLSTTASLTSTLAKKDQVIGELIDSLSSVLVTINHRTGRLDTTIDTLQDLVSGLAADRHAIGGTLHGLGELTSSVADLLHQGRAPLKESIKGLGTLSGNLADAKPVLDTFLRTLPVKLDRIGRLGSYGSWLNFYECSIQGNIPMPEGYFGDLGAKPVAGRCHR